MNFQPNALFFTLSNLFASRVTPKTKIIVGNEGSSRSSKTWDTFHFLVALCDANRDISLDIYVLRDTLVNCRDFTLKEFQDCLKTIGIYDSRMMISSPKPVYTLYGHKIKFRGLDEGEGYPSDIMFFNEILDGVEEQTFKDAVMRCRRMVICDWNPKYTDHWLFAWEKRDDTVFTKTTYKNNRHLQESVIKEIESYCPFNFDDLDLPEEERRPNEANVRNGTADPFRWKVYGLGERANREGLVFPSVKWIDAFPDDIDEISHGCDFGQANPSAIVKVGIRRRPVKSDLYIQKLFYAPTETSDMIAEVMLRLSEAEIERRLIGKEFKSDKAKQDFIDGIYTLKDKIHCDSNMGIETGWISDLRRKDIAAFGTAKYPGSRDYWISTIKRYNIHIVSDIDARKEQENFSYRVVDGITLSETIKKHDHFWSATGYAVVGDFRIE